MRENLCLTQTYDSISEFLQVFWRPETLPSAFSPLLVDGLPERTQQIRGMKWIMFWCSSSFIPSWSFHVVCWTHHHLTIWQIQGLFWSQATCCCCCWEIKENKCEKYKNIVERHIFSLTRVRLGRTSALPPWSSRLSTGWCRSLCIWGRSSGNTNCCKMLKK